MRKYKYKADKLIGKQMKRFMFPLIGFMVFMLPALALGQQYSNFHENHIDKIVFCSNPVMPGNEEEQDIRRTFKAGESIYAMAYFSKPFKELAKKPFLGVEVSYNGKKQKLTFTQPGKQKRFTYYKIRKQYTDKPHYPIEINPDKKHAANEVEVEGWGRFLENLEPGNHQLTIKLLHPGGVLARGKLGLEWQDFNPQEFNRKTKAKLREISSSHFKRERLPEIFRKDSRKFVDPDMTKERIKFKLLLSDEFKNAEEFSRVVIGNGSDWKILRDDETGQPTYKVNNRPIRVVYKGKDGWCYYIKKVFFAQKYKDNGEYASPKFVKATEHKRINCRNLK